MLELTKKRLTNNQYEMILRGSAESVAKAEAAIKPLCRQYFEWEEVYPKSSPGTALQGARYKEDLTQQQLAEKTGFTVKQISAFENNRARMDIYQAKTFAKTLEVDYRIFLSTE